MRGDVGGLMRNRKGWIAVAALAVMLAVVALAMAVSGGDSDNTSGPEAAAPAGSEVGTYTDVQAGAESVRVPTNIGNRVDIDKLREAGRMDSWVAFTGPSVSGEGRCFVVQSAFNAGYTSHGCATEAEVNASPAYGSYWPQGGKGFFAALVPQDATRVTANGAEVPVQNGLVLMPYGGDRLVLVATGPSGTSTRVLEPLPKAG